MPTELVLTALEQALTLRQPAPGLIIHADRGSRYTSAAVAYYLDTYFNLNRRHSAFGYRSPHQFKRDFQISIS